MDELIQSGHAQWAASTWDALPFDADAARAYGRIFAGTRKAGRRSRARLADLIIVATAVANGLELYTRNPRDFAGLDGIVKIVAVEEGEDGSRIQDEGHQLRGGVPAGDSSSSTLS